VSDVRRYRRQFAHYVGRPESTVDPPTPAQMLETFDRVLNFTQREVVSSGTHSKHPTAAERRDANVVNQFNALDADLQLLAKIRAGRSGTEVDSSHRIAGSNGAGAAAA
jgi:hypothetical protein